MYSGRKDNQKSRTRLRFYATSVIGAGCLLTLVSFFFYSQVNAQWKQYTQESSEVYSLHDKLVQHLGYGGFIHNFKNLVLRKTSERYEPQLRQSIIEIYQTIDALKSYEQYSADSLTSIRNTVREYEHNLNLALELIAAGASSEEIDKSVKVDDSDALAALYSFDSEVKARLQREGAELLSDFTLAIAVHIISTLLFLGILLFYFSLLSKANKKESELVQRALEGSKAKSDFLANMSHEIRTPLNGVMGMLQVLQRDLEEDRHIIKVNKALFSTKSLLTIINDILDFSKIEANQLLLEEIEFSISSVVESVVSDLLPAVSEKSIYLTSNIQKGLPDVWHGDPVRVRQIMLNLLSNAVKFTERGGVTLAVRETRRQEKQFLSLDITDTGIGMSKDAVANLFVRFSQADSTVTRRYGGTGLGMSITQNLVSLMGGEIKVASSEGKGTKIVVFLPLKKSETANESLKKDNLIKAAPDLSTKRILIAEDNDINQEIIKSMLANTKATLHFVGNGKAAIDSLADFRPDIVLMDIQMPVMDGVQACLKIRSSDSDIPIIALTANVMKEDVEKYKASGFNSHLGKPIDIDALYQTLEETLLVDLKST